MPQRIFNRRAPAHIPDEVDDALLRNVAGVIARKVEGVACMGEGLLRDFECEGGACADHGHGVTVRRWGEDVFVYIHLCCVEDADAKRVVEDVKARVRITLDNLLHLHPASIEVQVDEPAAQPAAEVASA